MHIPKTVLKTIIGVTHAQVFSFINSNFKIPVILPTQSCRKLCKHLIHPQFNPNNP